MATDRRLTVRRPTPWDQLTCCPKMGHRPARRLGRCVVQVSCFEIEVSQMRHHMPVTRCRARGTSVPDWDTCRPSGVFSKEIGFGTDPAPYQVSLATALSSRPGCYRDWAMDFRVVLSHLGTIVRWPWEDSVSGRTGLRQRWRLRCSARAVLLPLHTPPLSRGVLRFATPHEVFRLPVVEP